MPSPVRTTRPVSQGKTEDTPSKPQPAKPNPPVAQAPLPKTPPVASPILPPPHSLPAGILDLTNWMLALPVDTAIGSNPDHIMQPQLAQFALNPYFHVNEAKNGVVFQAHAGGATTKNSSYPRSELREMTNSGKTKANWSNSSGTHTMFVRQAITHLPAAKPEVVAGQIHDDSDDVIMIRLEGSHLFVEGDGDNLGDLDTQYSLGSVFTVNIEASAGRIKVWYNGVLKVDYTKSSSGLYFKAGCYTQSNTKKGDSASAYGEVIIYDLKVSHS